MSAISDLHFLHLGQSLLYVFFQFFFAFTNLAPFIAVSYLLYRLSCLPSFLWFLFAKYLIAHYRVQLLCNVNSFERMIT